MKMHLRANVLLLGSTFLICSLMYPLCVFTVAQGFCPTRASGSIIAGPDGNPVGSLLIAQEFKGAEWFHPRPSAVGYTANASGGSNLGANNPKLRERVEETLKTRSEQSNVPADAVTASGSGLDPHITLRNARGQLDRVVAAWTVKSKLGPAQVRTIIAGMLNELSFNTLAGLAGGEPLVCVQEVNLELMRKFQAK